MGSGRERERILGSELQQHKPGWAETWGRHGSRRAWSEQLMTDPTSARSAPYPPQEASNLKLTEARSHCNQRTKMKGRSPTRTWPPREAYHKSTPTRVPTPAPARQRTRRDRRSRRPRKWSCSSLSPSLSFSEPPLIDWRTFLITTYYTPENDATPYTAPPRDGSLKMVHCGGTWAIENCNRYIT